jgi:hypothetical protein
MAVISNPNVVSNGMAFAYDMSNNQKSFKGRPSTNTCSFVPYEYGYNSTKISNATPPVPPPITGYPIYKITSNDGTDSQQILYTATVDQVNGGTYTHSAYVYLESGNWVSAGQHWNPWDYGTPQYIPKGVWTRIEDPVTNSPNNYGNIAMSYNTDGAVYVTASQYELGSFATPFIGGAGATRSNTQALLDLTNNNIITANSLTYPSDGVFSFNGTSDYCQFPLVQTSPNNFTVEAWIYSTEHSSDTNIGKQIVLAYSNLNGWIFSLNGPASYLQLRHHNQSNSSTAYNLSSSTGLSLNTWHHVAATDNGTTVNLFVNGKIVASMNSVAATTNGTITTTIGAWAGTTSATHFKGNLPTIKIYNRGLSASEVEQNFNAIRGRYGI